MNSGQISPDDEWLSLHEAAGLLGVHPGTVRIWSDKGLLPVYRTQGGHRRYKRSEVLLWANTSRHRQAIDPANVVQAAVRNIRLQISEGRLEAEPWYQKLDEDARNQYRLSAHTLIQGLMNYLSAEGDGAASEAHSIGYEYASRARRSGLDTVDAARAFLFFRDVLLQSVIQVYQEANVPSGQAWGEILHKVNAFTDLILLNLLETYNALGSNNV
jgi:excisionase family DNA binding protein